MKKTFGAYFAFWALLLGLFNLITFIIPEVDGVEKFTESFWIGYVFITIAFIGQLICAYVALGGDNAQKTFYNFSMASASYTGLIASVIFGSICMIIPFPYWLSVIACALVLVFNVIAVVKAAAVAGVVSQIDTKVKVQTYFIKNLTLNAEDLMGRAQNAEIKAECKKVYEAIRYSDPMSNDALAGVESQITVRFGALARAVLADDVATSKQIADEVLLLVRDRNNRCKMFK